MPLQTINPATGALVREYEEAGDDDVAAALEAAESAFHLWRRTSFEERGRALRKAADALDARKEELAKLMAIEMGKPLAQGRSELEKCAWVCRYYAEHAAAFLGPEPVATDASKSFVAFQPLGPVLAVMPWNFPFWQVFRFAAPALMAGNVGLLKHSSNVCGCALSIEEILHAAGVPKDAFRALLIEEILHAAGVPKDAFRALLIESKRVARVISAPEVKAVTLTGSTPAGQAVAAKAGEVLKKTVLELGGSDPYVVLEDADLEAAAEACVSSRLINSGQSCVAAKRFIVVEPVRRRFEELFVEKMKAKRMGDPLVPGIDIGPLARRDLRDDLQQQVQRSLAKGARALLGGQSTTGPTAFFAPCVLTDVAPGMAAFDEELFGPVAALVGAKDEAEAIRLANQSAFGLGAAVFTSDLERGERIAAESLEAGSCFVNTFVRSDPRLPFGGIKESGYGRELSAFGIREFVNVKTVYVK